MIRRRSNNSRRLWMGDPASSAPEQLAGVQHGLEIRGLSQAQSIVILCVEHFGLLLRCDLLRIVSIRGFHGSKCNISIYVCINMH